MMQQYNTTYKGVVVQNDDPSQSGRVKVFVPYLHASLLPLTQNQYDENINFGMFGKNVNQQNKNQIDLTEYVETLKSKLPWCNVIMPITGETGNAKFNNATGLATPSDSDSPEAALALSDSELGGGPLDLYGDISNVWGSGAAAGGVVATPNPGGYNLDKGYGAGKGNFAVPSVNSQVWVNFMNGDPQFPVIVGAAPSTLDFQQNIDPSGYPGTYENKGSAKTQSTSDELIYRNMSVSNSGSSKTVVSNTTNNRFESKIHVSGSSETVTNDGSKNVLIAGDKNNVTVGNVFEDHKNSSNIHVEGPRTIISRGDNRKVVGSGNISAAQSEKMELSKISKYKALFETKRSAGNTLFSSTEQSKSGTPSKCPQCSSDVKRPSLIGEGIGEQLNNISPTLLDSIGKFTDPIADLLTSLTSMASKTLSGYGISLEQFPQTSDCSICNGKGESPSSQGGKFEKEEKKEQIGDMYVAAAPTLAKYSQSIRGQ